MSLIELLTAAAITATMMGSSVVVLRGSYAAWQAHEQDLERAESAHALLRHVVRHLRQADSVVAVTNPASISGLLRLQMPNGDLYVWDHDPGTDTVLFGVGSATSLLADHIESFRFHAYELDGVSLTTFGANVQTVRCTATVTMPYSGQTRTVSCTGWVRRW